MHLPSLRCIFPVSEGSYISTCFKMTHCNSCKSDQWYQQTCIVTVVLMDCEAFDHQTFTKIFYHQHLLKHRRLTPPLSGGECEVSIYLLLDHHLRLPPPHSPHPVEVALVQDLMTSDLSPRLLVVGETEGQPCCCSALVLTSHWSQSHCPSLPRTRVCENAPSPAESGDTSESPRSTWRTSPILDPWTSSCTLSGFSWSPWFLK